MRYRLSDESLHSETGFATRDEADDRAADVESDQRRGRFVDPRLAQTTLGDWVTRWLEALDVGPGTSATYHSHLRNHILPRFGTTELGELSRMGIKGWAKSLRRNLSDRSVADVVGLLSMILGEAVDEGLIGANPCRKLRLNAGDQPERPFATAEEVNRITHRMTPANATLVTTAAYTGMRWGELAGLQWSRVDLDQAQVTITRTDGALHELGGRLELGPPKTPAAVRTIDLPPFLVGLLGEHQHHYPGRFVFTGADGGLYRRSNFRRRVWLPAVEGCRARGWTPIKPGMHFHDLRHTHKTWLIEDEIPEVLQHVRLGHKFHGIRGIYSHVTQLMIQRLLDLLQARWERTGSTACLTSSEN
ncbi:tyrosine-type recombinase/integrase [Amycolatopsis magusensis]|uniref:tyrosine-type recombinase/integrase n=1 Tax=Amycolatopsis magusensis TaxID=882444 RepID=UPI001AEA530A|nr:site-specific integrase [Amycolatopsis magusensis]